MPEAAHASRSTLVGRSAALAVLEGALHAAEAGRGTLAVVSGEAGIGKSAIAERVSVLARELGFAIVTGRAWEFADAPPWFPLRSGLRQLGVEPDDLEPALATGALPLWERVLEGLAVTTGELPLLWLIEDVHAADVQTLDLLNFLSQPLRALRAVLLVTARFEDARLGERASERLARLARDGLDLRLDLLTPELVRELVAVTLDNRLSEATLERVVERAGGNPLFAVEYARALASERPGTEAVRLLPPSLRQVVLERARWLPEATQHTLFVGAVLGRSFAAAAVARVLGVTPAKVIDQLLVALRAGIVDEFGLGQFRFSHVLVRDAFYDAMPPGQRAEYHARAVSSLPSADHSDGLIVRAQHALRGLPFSDTELTRDLVERSLLVLESRRAYDRAYTLRREADQAESVGLLPARPARALLGSARLAREAGRFSEAREICQRLVATARAERDPELLAEAALTLGAHLRPGVVDQALVEALREAQGLLPPGAERLHCLVRARLAAALQPAEDVNLPIAMARRAIADARELGDPNLLREVLFFGGSALVDFAPAPERFDVAAELLLLAEQAGDLPRALQASVRLAMEQTMLGDFSDFSRRVDRALSLSDELGREPRYRWRPLLLSSMRAAMSGRFDESERLIVEVEQLGVHCDDPALGLSLPMHKFFTLHLQRKDSEVDALVPTVQGLLRDSPLGVPILALIALNIGAQREDRARARQAFQRLEPYIQKFQVDPDFCALLAEGVAFAGSPAQQRELRARLAGGAPELSLGHVTMSYMGPAARAVAALDAALGDFDGAYERLRACLAEVSARGHLPWVAQVEYELGKLLVARGEPDQARLHLEAAARQAEALSMYPLSLQARSRARRRALDRAVRAPAS